MLTIFTVLLGLSGCKGGDEPQEETGLEETGDSTPDTDEDTEVTECLTVPSEITPDDGDSSVYYRETIRVAFSDVAEDASFVLSREDTGEEHPVSVEWNDSYEIATLTPTPALSGATAYSLDITVCETSYVASFATSIYGGELEMESSELVDRTYAMEFGQVDFIEPEGIGGLLSLYLDIPLLIGVRSVEGEMMDLIGAQGRIDTEGDYKQRKKLDGEDVPTWEFGDVDFSEAPYFQADSELITLKYSGIDIPVSDFHLEATFSPDGESYGGGQLWGLGDTRNMGELIIGSSDPNYVCDLVAAVGASCEACPTDGEPYCLFLKGQSIQGTYQEGLVIEEIVESE